MSIFRKTSSTTEKTKETEQKDPMEPFVLKDMKDYTPPSVDLFMYFKDFITKDDDGWHKVLNSENCTVSTKESKFCKVNVIRIRSEFEHDASWIADLVKDDKFFMLKAADDLFLEWKEVKKIDENNTVNYFASKAPLRIIAPRDFLTFRNYYTSPEGEEMILIRSVLHDDFPEKKDIVRAHVHLTAYYIHPKEGGGCVMNYMTQTDMRGYIPIWAVNKGASILGQRAVDQLNQMSKIYPEYLEEQKKEKEKKKQEEVKEDEEKKTEEIKSDKIEPN
eukprot:gene7688-12154_t